MASIKIFARGFQVTGFVVLFSRGEFFFDALDQRLFRTTAFFLRGGRGDGGRSGGGGTTSNRRRERREPKRAAARGIIERKIGESGLLVVLDLPGFPDCAGVAG